MFNVEFEEVTNQFCAEFDTVVHTGDATLGEKTITANGVYNASSDDLDGYSKVNVNVPTGGDTPVIESLSVTPTTSQQTYNDSEVDGYKPVVVNPIPPEYIVPTGTKNITQNGTGIDVAAFASANVNVPNSYSASDEGKVVDSGALVAQTSTTFTQNGTYDTTLNDEVVVNVSGGGGTGAVTQDQNGFLVLSPDAGGGGGGKTNIDIGIQNTSIPSIFNMFYALESGTAATGQYTPAQALPNVDTELFDTGLTTVHGLFIADESQDILNTATTPDGLLFGIVFNPSYDDTGNSDYNGYTYACSRDTVAMQNTKNGAAGRFVSRGSWTITNGKFIFKSAFNRNDNYCPFRSSHTYRWVAW